MHACVLHYCECLLVCVLHACCVIVCVRVQACLSAGGGFCVVAPSHVGSRFVFCMHHLVSGFGLVSVGMLVQAYLSPACSYWEHVACGPVFARKSSMSRAFVSV